MIHQPNARAVVLRALRRTLAVAVPLAFAAGYTVGRWLA